MRSSLFCASLLRGPAGRFRHSGTDQGKILNHNLIKLKGKLYFHHRSGENPQSQLIKSLQITIIPVGIREKVSITTYLKTLRKAIIRGQIAEKSSNTTF